MKIDPRTGLLENTAFRASPHQDERPQGTDIELLVIHGISLPPGIFGGPWIDALFTNTLDPDVHPYFRKIHGYQVSAHLVIHRAGEVVQYVPFHRRAWHTGESCFRERTGCNDFSIGIELEGTDDLPYDDAQYLTLGRITRALMTAYPGITPDRIAGHCDIAPGRKIDPGPAFDWERYRVLLA